MEREVKHRGKMGNNEWVKGSLSTNKNNSCQISDWDDDFRFWYTVDRETVGQYTEQKDRFGTEIYEGDIVKTIYDSADEIRYCPELMSYIGVPTEKEFREEFNKGNICLSDCHDINLDFSKGEVIGNIYDNPNIIKL